jgi:hypothetical protein
MTITDSKQLPELIDLVHDYWFNVEQLALDPKTSSVVLRVEPSHSALNQGSASGLRVVIKNVEDLTIKDTEKVRDYDINEIIFDPATRTLLLTGGIPIEVVFRVSALEIRVSPASLLG